MDPFHPFCCAGMLLPWEWIDDRCMTNRNSRHDNFVERAKEVAAGSKGRVTSRQTAGRGLDGGAAEPEDITFTLRAGALWKGKSKK